MSVTHALSAASTSNFRSSDNDGRSAAIFASSTLVTDLSLDPGTPCQTRDAVRAARLALVEKVVMKPSPVGQGVAIDLAALFPSLKQEIGLSFVLAGPFARRVLQPGVDPARVNMEKPTHRPHREPRCRAMNAYFTLHPRRITTLLCSPFCQTFVRTGLEGRRLSYFSEEAWSA